MVQNGCVMKNCRCRITITLEESLVRWVRNEAARNETSVSHFLASILNDRMVGNGDYERAMREALARKPFLNSNGPYLTREHAHNRNS